MPTLGRETPGLAGYRARPLYVVLQAATRNGGRTVSHAPAHVSRLAPAL